MAKALKALYANLECSAASTLLARALHALEGEVVDGLENWAENIEDWHGSPLAKLFAIARPRRVDPHVRAWVVKGAIQAGKAQCVAEAAKHLSAMLGRSARLSCATRSWRPCVHPR